MSNIQVSVEWKTPAVFAGETLQCVIQLKNIAQPINQRGSTSRASIKETSRERWKHQTATHVREQGADISLRRQRLGTPLNRPSPQESPLDGIRKAPQSDIGNNPHDRQIYSASRRHRRSVSIVTLSSDLPSSERWTHRPVQSHGRAASLQHLPSRSIAPIRGATILPQTTESSSSTYRNGREPLSNRTAEAPTAFKFPTYHTPDHGHFARGLSDTGVRTVADRTPPRTHVRSPSTSSSVFQDISPAKGYGHGATDSTGGTTRPPLSQKQRHRIDEKVAAPESHTGTPRSSADLYSVSNISSDTLASEYISQEHDRFVHRPVAMQQQPAMAPSGSSQNPETLMMGYGKIMGSFHLDPSLINTSLFDSVRRKAVIGNQGGGGVVRAESMKRQSGFLGSLGWNTIGESLGGLLGSSEMSSIKEVGSANTAKWIPILSTAQSLLFVDLRLEPGQCQSFAYTYQLPLGVPPSFRGKAIKIAYSLVIGIQRATRSAQSHNVRHVDFPFQVLPGVNGNGDTLGHDLMSPHIMLHSQPFISALGRAGNESHASTQAAASQARHGPVEEDFRSYIDGLLNTSSQTLSPGLLSPSATGARPSDLVATEPGTVEGAITLAIQRSNYSKQSKVSATRFEITRSGNRVAVIMLARPAYRLGELIPITVDFHQSENRCFSVRVTLETVEQVDPAIALRSQASILRISRKILATQHEWTTSADRIYFNLAIPSNSTPEFVTTGVSLQWRLRFEFVTSDEANATDGDVDMDAYGTLEQVSHDERGFVSIAVQAVPCETLEVTLPIRLYGSIHGLDKGNSIRESQI
ncbi:MAG: hypothetical protein Q9222_000258 [Ikaeria aurantiellina]